MPMIAVFTAAEIAAAEAAAIAAAEAAAVAAAEAAAVEAATAAAAEAAATQTATTAATTAATDAGTQGILQANTGFTGALPQGYNAGQVEAITQGAGQGINVAGPAQVLPPAGAEQGITQAASPYSLTGPAPTIPNPTYSLPSPSAGQGMTMGGSNAGITNASANSLYPGAGTSSSSSLMDGFTSFAKTNPNSTAALGYTGLYNMGAFDPRNTGFNNQSYNGPLNNYRMSPNFQGRTANPEDYQYTPRQYAEGGILYAGGGPVEQMSNANAIGANTGYPMANINKAAYSTPYQTPVSQNVVTGTADTGVNPMTGEQSRFAEGGITSYAKGGNLSSSLDYYTDMMDGKSTRSSVAEKGDPGIYRDTDPDTAYLSAPEAAQVRMAKLNKRANMQLPAQKRPTPMGQLNLRPPGTKAESGGSSLDPENAAQGGIMQAGGHLGGYAAGGQPRLLKGPGDGMSDNIPATIAGKRPARLADGEFVVPADVVSHLGNGSTEAGAKKLHQMMTEVRKARTGNPKQGKQINPNKFTPK